MGLGLLYAALAAGLCSDHPLVVLTRRELAAYFYSPIAYLVLFGLTCVGWYLFSNFVTLVTRETGQPLIEPIVQYYILDWFPIICVMFVVPVLTMRLLSEEKRSGTMEVLLTAPVSESSVVLSKFLAVLIFFMLLWLPWGLFLVGLRVLGGQPFDYRPLLSYFIALACTGGAFLSMGMFFSSLTRNQIIGAVLTFVGMLLLTAVFFVRRLADPGTPLFMVATPSSYVYLWIRSLAGILVPQLLLFPLSASVLWLFLTVKVLEARRWA